jgi:hypothetical protein
MSRQVETTTKGSCQATAAKGSGATASKGAGAERRLIRLVWKRCQRFVLEACKYSSVPPAFLGALTANESGGAPRAARFEPAVYAHLRAIAEGRTAGFGMVRTGSLAAEFTDMLPAKASTFHARFLDAPFATGHAGVLAHAQDEALRELATSWGFTQIMGYHMVGRAGTTRDLLKPSFHYRVALSLLAQFAATYQLDVAREFAEMFRCWNTGRPDGQTFDPQYVKSGLRRMELCREFAGT